jgi:uncharacterized phage protein (TIGR02216 family)
MMAMGLGTLRLPPSSFWSMTPRELTAAMHPLTAIHTPSGPPSRNDLAAMMMRFPDAATSAR